jgi:hypothetical protein
MLLRIGSVLAALCLFGSVSEAGTTSKLGPEFRVNSHTAGEQYSPAVARLSNGGFVVVWHNQDKLSGQRYTADGNATVANS